MHNTWIGLGWLVVMLGGCWSATLPNVLSCPKGQQAVDGQCMPMPTLVFRQCMDAFRTASVERAKGHDVEVGADVQGYAGAKVRRSQQDTERREYAGVNDLDMQEAITECRRQEEVERQGLLAAAHADAHTAREEAKTARDEKDAAQAELADARAEVEAIEAAMAEADQARREAEESHAATRSLLEERHPCTAGVWTRCAEQAADAHRRADYLQAHTMYALSCEGGVGDACSGRGALLEHGLGTAPDLRSAAEQYERGCELGSDHGCAGLERLTRVREHPRAPIGDRIGASGTLGAYGHRRSGATDGG
jgi:hypothetical protein